MIDMVTQTLFSQYELVLPHFWNRNTVYRDVRFTTRPTSATIRFTILNVGRYHFGARREETNAFLGFTVNVNGYDVKVLYPVTPSNWISVDVTDLMVSGSNRVSCIIWRSIIDWVDDWFVTFTLELTTDVEGELQPLPTPQASGGIFEAFYGMFQNMINFLGWFFIIYIVLQFLPLLTSFLRGIIEEREEKRKKAREE